MLLVDKYRPRRLAQVVGQTKAVRVLQRCLARANYGKIAIAGGSGTGKTSLAYALAGELGAHAGDVHELDAASKDGAGVAQVREIAAEAERWGRFSLCVSPPTVWIVNEYHALSPQAVVAWLTLLERWPVNWWVIFTTTRTQENLFGPESGAFGSRLTRIKLTSQGLCTTYARLVRGIAAREGMNGKDLGWYENRVKRARNNLRQVIQEIDDGAALEDGDR